MELFIVGKYKKQTDQGGIWEFQGVFDSKEKAENACIDHKDYFIGPAILNDILPDETLIEWPGAYYPELENNWRIKMEEFIRNISKLDLQEGDIIVVKSKQKISLGGIDTIKETMKEVIDQICNNVKILVMDQGMDLEILRKKENE